MTPDFHQLNQVLDKLIRRVSRDLLLPEFSQGMATELVCYKPDNSVVTRVDIEAQNIFEVALRDLVPDSCIVGEEKSDNKPQLEEFRSHRYRWIVDAVDGTHRFIASEPDFSTMVCLCIGDQPLYGWIYLPTEDRLFAGGKGVGVYDNGKLIETDAPLVALHDVVGSISPAAFFPYEEQIKENCRVFGGLRHQLCAGYKFAGLLTGALDFAAFGRAAPWDLAAGFVLLEALGGHAATWQNRPLDMDQIYNQRREWYLATRRAVDWQEIHDNIFYKVVMESSS